METPRGEVTLLLDRLSDGDRSPEDELMPRVYLELHRIAGARLRNERAAHTLQATALVHEAYVKLCGAGDIVWQNRIHFYRVAARLMRHILVDYARKRNSEKNNFGAPAIRLEGAIAISEDGSAVALDIDEMLDRLALVSPRQAQIVEMRFFAGLTEEEIASALGLSIRTIRRDWLMARAWLHGQLKRT
jgi:RNA polymerase sigma factor (TIGR02999 family)